MKCYPLSCLLVKELNDELNAKLEKANATSSCVEHVVICNRCKDVNFDGMLSLLLN
jgi:hypothetical protein